eukprot:TRINITY_DN2321_c0_g1_i1.p1 TRINITY_DN2321_c0_g1~~TRINITY_DN2321_c0_g1_i1.p1  ORF type:complete len:305 (+),score=91.44 TRINITY_DN2321_c0_g1_i1:39-917(+)
MDFNVRESVTKFFSDFFTAWHNGNLESFFNEQFSNKFPPTLSVAKHTDIQPSTILVGFEDIKKYFEKFDLENNRQSTKTISMKHIHYSHTKKYFQNNDGQTDFYYTILGSTKVSFFTKDEEEINWNIIIQYEESSTSEKKALCNLILNWLNDYSSIMVVSKPETSPKDIIDIPAAPIEEAPVLKTVSSDKPMKTKEKKDLRRRKKVFIGGLPISVTKQEIFDLFSKYNPANINIMVNEQRQFTKVTFAVVEEVFEELITEPINYNGIKLRIAEAYGGKKPFYNKKGKDQKKN